MAQFPTLTSVPFVSIGGTMVQKVLHSNFEDLGKTQRKRKWLYPRRSIELEYKNIKDSELQTILQFYADRYGSYNAFTFIFPTDLVETYTSEYIGTGDGSTTGFNAPFKNTTSRVIYSGAAEQSITFDSTGSANVYIDEDGGQDGVDSIQFTVAPSSGTRITCDFTGNLAIRCVFEDAPEYSRSRWQVGLNDCTVKLKGLLMDE